MGQHLCIIAAAATDFEDRRIVDADHLHGLRDGGKVRPNVAAAHIIQQRLISLILLGGYPGVVPSVLCSLLSILAIDNGIGRRCQSHRALQRSVHFCQQVHHKHIG